MSYKADESTPGVLIYHLTKALNKADAARLIRDVEQALSSSKSRIIMDISADAATANHGYGYLEKAFRSLRTLAQKMQGDIKYVLPKKISERIAGTAHDLAATIESMTESNNPEDMREEQIKLKEQVIFQEAQIKKLTGEVNLLTKKTKELVSLLSLPNTDIELKAALEHYKKLAAETQTASPNLIATEDAEATTKTS